MKRYIGFLTAAMLALEFLLTANAFAVGTVAGTSIDNKATATYTVGSSTITKDSNITTIKVAEILNVTVTWQDGGSVSVLPGDANKKLLFRVTNTGNGTEAFTLAGLSTLAGDQFDPTLNLIYIDNGNGTWEPASDLAYNPASKPSIAPNGYINVWVDNNIPTNRPDTTPLQDGDLGNSQLSATAVTGSGAAGTVIAGAGQGGTDAVVGTTTGTASVIGSYVTSSVVVAIVKSEAVVNSPTFGNQPVPGAEIEYTITIQVTSGSGTASNVTIKDPIPANTTYKPNSISLNTIAKGDGAGDSDGCDFNITNANAVTVGLGNMTTATPTQTIKFKVIVN